MIFNLSLPQGYSVNDNIAEKYKSVQYCTVFEVGQHLVHKYKAHTAWMAKVDLADAYRIVPINRLDWKHLGIRVAGKYYIDRMLPMGAASSCQIFQRISDALKEMLVSRCNAQVAVFNYLDDFLFVAPSKECCEETLQSFEKLCEELGVPIAAHKTIRATTCISFLGLGINARDCTLFIPPEKGEKAKKKLERFLKEDKPRVKVWQSMAGTLSHLSQVISAGRIYLSSIYERLSGILSQRKNVRRWINEEVRQDIEVWLHLLDMAPVRQFKVLNPDESAFAPLITDSSTTVGFGAMWGDQWLSGRWPKNKSANIATLELYPIFLALSLSHVHDAAIKIYTDNQALVTVINKLYCRDRGLRKLMRPIVSWCMSRNVRLIASHIPGSQNVGPDLLSRGKIQEFLTLYPHMSRSPLTIPYHLGPNCGLIDWKIT